MADSLTRHLNCLGHLEDASVVLGHDVGGHRQDGNSSTGGPEQRIGDGLENG